MHASLSHLSATHGQPFLLCRNQFFGPSICCQDPGCQVFSPRVRWVGQTPLEGCTERCVVPCLLRLGVWQCLYSGPLHDWWIAYRMWAWILFLPSTRRKDDLPGLLALRRGEVMRPFILACFVVKTCFVFPSRKFVGTLGFQILHQAVPVLCSCFRLAAWELDGPVRMKAQRAGMFSVTSQMAVSPSLRLFVLVAQKSHQTVSASPERPPVTSYFPFIIFLFLCFFFVPCVERFARFLTPIWLVFKPSLSSFVFLFS